MAVALLGTGLFVTANPATAQAEEIGGWELDALNVPQAWETTRGEGVTIAVVDTGVGEHPYFDDKDVLPGYSFIDREDDGRDDGNGHGSSVAAAALSVAPEATLMPVKVAIGSTLLDDEGQMGGQRVGEEVIWAVDNGADILALPYVTSARDIDDMTGLQYAIDRGVIVIAGSGNDPDVDDWYPASYEGVFTVGGTDRNNDLYVNSAPNDTMTAAAPATDITTVTLGSYTADPGFEQAWGTSMSTGLAAGVAALVLAADPGVDGNNAIARMIDTSTDLGEPGWDRHLGHGLLNAGAAVESTIDHHTDNPLGHVREPGSTLEDSDEESTDEAAPAGPQPAGDDNSILGLAPWIFWALTAFVIITILTTTAALLVRQRRQPQPASPDQQWPYNPGSHQNPAPPQNYR
ncbi:S8 family serine peptidase [Natronoglycomyces albus]|uniref:S8 family serine peptidase n=1 Tax=Natronoglycomyces albus TaxID=2811108 RepID=A0A895XT40_9ACTN|nr:S8 family serine peptidase [Natronoglycomyces albus]QSB05430.1 S8 family serine peptidase [Natronoglycomyces albus]